VRKLEHGGEIVAADGDQKAPSSLDALDTAPPLLEELASTTLHANPRAGRSRRLS